MLRSALFPKVTAGDPQPLVDEARRLVKQRLARPRQVEALRREIARSSPRPEPVRAQPQIQHPEASSSWRS